MVLIWIFLVSEKKAVNIKMKIIEEYKNHLISEHNENYIVTVNKGRFKGLEISYKTSLEYCKKFIDDLKEINNN